MKALILPALLFLGCSCQTVKETVPTQQVQAKPSPYRTFELKLGADWREAPQLKSQMIPAGVEGWVFVHRSGWSVVSIFNTPFRMQLMPMIEQMHDNLEASPDTVVSEITMSPDVEDGAEVTAQTTEPALSVRMIVVNAHDATIVIQALTTPNIQHQQQVNDLLHTLKVIQP